MVYEGNWEDDRPHGEGKESFGDGSFYEGYFHEGLKHGDNCVYRWSNGKMYVGPFRNGYMEGRGALTMGRS